MNLYLHSESLFNMLSNCCFLPQAEQRIILLTNKGVAQSILENFGFYNKYNDEHEKVFIIFWTLQTNFCDSVHVEWLIDPCSKKVAAVCCK